MVAFDKGMSSGDKSQMESPGYGQTAKRKYLFIVDDKPNIMEEPRKSLSFDCKMILATEILDEPYSNENAMRIAILQEVLGNFRKDIDEVGQDNKELAVSGMMVNQVLETILVKLDELPVLASHLSGHNGVEFEHISLGKGKIVMLIESDIVTVKIRLGTLLRDFDEP